MQSKSITSLKFFNDAHFLDFYFPCMDDSLSYKNLSGAHVLFGLQPLMTIATASIGFNHFLRKALQFLSLSQE